MIELRISGEGVTTANVLSLLLELNVDASVSSTTNIVKDEQGHRHIEAGLHIVMPECSQEDFKDKVWPNIKSAFSLRCGWMDASTKSYRGCTENYMKLDACPYKRSS